MWSLFVSPLFRIVIWKMHRNDVYVIISQKMWVSICELPTEKTCCMCCVITWYALIVAILSFAVSLAFDFTLTNYWPHHRVINNIDLSHMDCLFWQTWQEKLLNDVSNACYTIHYNTICIYYQHNGTYKSSEHVNGKHVYKEQINKCSIYRHVELSPPIM